MFEGVLYKKKKGLLGIGSSLDDWKSFWCTIEGDVLKVFQLPGKDMAPKPGAKLVQKGFLSLGGCKIVRRSNAPADPAHLEFSVQNDSNNSVDFKAVNEEDLERWIAMIESVSGMGLEELSEIDFDLGKELRVVEEATGAAAGAGLGGEGGGDRDDRNNDAAVITSQNSLSGSGRLDIKRNDSTSSVASSASSYAANGMKASPTNPLTRSASHAGSLSATSTDHNQPIQSMYKILVQRSMSKSTLHVPPVSTTSTSSSSSYEIFGAVIEKAGQGVGFGMLISENSIPGATYITEIRASVGVKWIGSAENARAGASPQHHESIKELKAGDQVLRVQDEDIRGYEINDVAKLLGSFHEGACVRFVFARGSHVKNNDVFQVPTFPSVTVISQMSTDSTSSRHTPRVHHRAKSSNDLTYPAPVSPTGSLAKSYSQSFSFPVDPSNFYYNVILQKGPAGVGLGISIVEDTTDVGAHGAVIKEVFRTVHINYISERAGGSLLPGDKILSIDREDFQNAPISEVARRLSTVQEYGTVRLKMQRHVSPVEVAPLTPAAVPANSSLATIFESPTNTATSAVNAIETAVPDSSSNSTAVPPEPVLDSLPPPSSIPAYLKPPTHSKSRSDGSIQNVLNRRSEDLKEGGGSQSSSAGVPASNSPVPSPRLRSSEGGSTPREIASMVRSPVSPAVPRANSSKDFIQFEAIIEKGPPGVGFGILIAEDKAEDTVVVKKIKPEIDLRFVSPSANGAIHEKDILIKIDDDEVDDWGIERIVKLLASVRVGTAVRFRFQRRIIISDPAATAASLERLRSYSEASNNMLNARQRSDSASKIALPVTPSRDSVVSAALAPSVDTAIPLAMSSVESPSKDDEELRMSDSASTTDPISPLSTVASAEKVANPSVPSLRFPDVMTSPTSMSLALSLTPESDQPAPLTTEGSAVAEAEALDDNVDHDEKKNDNSTPVVENTPAHIDAETDVSLNDTAEVDAHMVEASPVVVSVVTETFEIGASAATEQTTPAPAVQIYDPFTCPVCKNAFASSGDLSPLVLTCGHSICAADTKTLSSQDAFSCPVCSVSQRCKDYPGGLPSANHGLIAILLAAPHLVRAASGVISSAPSSAAFSSSASEAETEAVFAVASEIDSSAAVISAIVEPVEETVAVPDLPRDDGNVVAAEPETESSSAPVESTTTPSPKEKEPEQNDIAPAAANAVEVEVEAASSTSSVAPEPAQDSVPLCIVVEEPRKEKAQTCSGCGEATPAYFCEDCKTDFCENCDSDVHKFKLFRSHQRCPIEVKYLMTTTCAEHGEVTKLFCEQIGCKKFVCSACCGPTGSHSSHDCRLAKDILTEKKRAINSQMQAERDVMRQLEALKTSMEGSLQNTAAQAEALSNHVAADFAAARAFLDALEQHILDGIASHAAEKSSDLSARLVETNACLDNLVASSAKTETIRSLGVEELLAHSDDRLEERREASTRASALLASSTFIDSVLRLDCTRSSAAAAKTLSYALLDGATLISAFPAPTSNISTISVSVVGSEGLQDPSSSLRA